MGTAGLLIRQLRLERNYSQAGLSRGICAPSYLSKIEQGQAEPSPEVLDRLFAALGVTYCREETLLNQARECLAAYYEAREREEEPETGWLDEQLDRLTYSDLCLSCQLYRVFRLLDAGDRTQAETLCRRLEPQRGQMDREQQARYWQARAALSTDPPQILEYLRQAELQMPCAVARLQVAYVLYHMGQYSQCIEAAEQAYRMAADEGDLYVLIWASFLLGSCYTDRDLGFAEKYYDRALRLGKKQRPQLADWAAYNLGASYLEWGQPEKALYWLTRTRPVDGNDSHNLLLYQKLSILYAQTGKPKEARAALEQAREVLRRITGEDWERALYGDMLEFARQLLEGDAASPDYEALLLRLYADAGEKLGFGYRKFYGLYLVRLYRSQRRYKDALRITEEVSGMEFPK